MRRWELLADTDGSFHDHEASHRDRTANITLNDGRVDVNAHGGSAQGVTIMGSSNVWSSSQPQAATDPRWSRSQTTNVNLLSPNDILAAALIGHIRRVVTDSAGVIINMGRKRRLFTGNQRQAVLMGSPRCIWPGCDQTSGQCQADHLHE